MKLLMSQEGELACTTHAPRAGTDSFVFGRWRPVTFGERVDFQAEVGRPPRCETCRAIEARHAEGLHVEHRSSECTLCAGGVA